MYLSGSNVDGSHNVSSMCIESADTARHSATHQILLNIEIH